MPDIKFKYEGSSLISEGDIRQVAEGVSNLPDLLANLGYWKTGIPQEQIPDISEVKYIFIAGMGGAILAFEAVFNSILGDLEYVAKSGRPKAVFLDNDSPGRAQAIEKIVQEADSTENFLVLAISRSGQTLETLANLDFLWQVFSKKFGSAGDRFLILTEKQADSRLSDIASEKNLRLIGLEPGVVGRYSAFSKSSLLPMLLSGLDIGSFLAGASQILTNCLDPDISKNQALASASITFIQRRQGLDIVNNFFFNSRLEILGRWLNQLIAESLGKTRDSGITPITSIGSSDLHSMLQLYISGPRDKLTNFIFSPAPEDNDQLNDNLEITIEAIYDSVKKSYLENSLPFMEITLPEISEYSLGQFMMFKMAETVILAHLLKVNPFDQPAVEEYKSNARKILNETNMN